jgi:hypothetical protein
MRIEQKRFNRIGGTIESKSRKSSCGKKDIRVKKNIREDRLKRRSVLFIEYSIETLRDERTGADKTPIPPTMVLYDAHVW